MFHLRRCLEQTPKEFEFLRSKLSQSREQLDHAHQQNERLVAALSTAKEQLAALRAEVDQLAAPPNSYGTFLQAHPEGTVDIFTAGRKLKVNLAPGVTAAELQRGQEVLLNEALNVVAAGGTDPAGEVVRLKDRLDAQRHHDPLVVQAILDPNDLALGLDARHADDVQGLVEEHLLAPLQL